jgi:hypothetical protein
MRKSFNGLQALWLNMQHALFNALANFATYTKNSALNCALELKNRIDQHHALTLSLSFTSGHRWLANVALKRCFM